jgi:hypothetical protein
VSVTRNKEFVNQIKNNTNSKSFHTLNAFSSKPKKMNLSQIYIQRNKSKNYFIPRISAGNEQIVIKRTPEGSKVTYPKGKVRFKKL